MKGVKEVELQRYIGNGKPWHEIASFPAWFQRGCTSTTARYIDKGKYVEVKNTCIAKGKEKVKIGKAFTTDMNNVLKVQFFAPFKADYIIEFVDQDYTYAVVGSSGKGYLWILSRKEKTKKTIYDELVNIAKEAGYNVDRLVIDMSRID